MYIWGWVNGVMIGAMAEVLINGQETLHGQSGMLPLHTCPHPVSGGLGVLTLAAAAWRP